MLENITIDSVLRQHFNAICSDKLSEDKIDINTDIEIPDSKDKYIKTFAMFLKDTCYKGYAFSESIFKKLMDIIEFEGYEYQIITSYIDILCEYLNIDSYKIEWEVTGKDIPSVEKSIEIINKYLETLHYITENNIANLNSGMFIEDGSDNASVVTMINEVEYPIDLIYKSIMESQESISNEQFIECVYVIYNNNLSAYSSILQKYKNPYTVSFLLNATDNDSLDILVDTVKSIQFLADTIKIYHGFNLTGSINTNVRRLIELLTINMAPEQIAIMIGTDYNFWKKFDEENPYNLNTLSNALRLYEENPDKYHVLDAIEYIENIKGFYDDDAYFYTRHHLMIMRYDIFCNNFLLIYNELKDIIDKEKLTDLYIECIYGLRDLFNENVNTALDRLHDELVYLVEKDYENTKNIYNNDEIRVLSRVKSEIDIALHTLNPA